MRGPRWQWLLLVLAVLVAAAVAAVVVLRGTADRPPPRTPLAVFIGDSYTAGTGASVPAARWANRLARVEGWRMRNLALGGTGYVATSSGPGCGRAVCPAFADRIATAARLKPDIVVVSGGRNDTTRDPAEVAAAVAAFYPALRKAVGSARIVAVSPLWDASAPPARLTSIGDDVRQAATAADGRSLQVGQPLRSHPDLLASDGLHPNDAGHAAIARAVQRALAERSTTSAGRPRRFG